MILYCIPERVWRTLFHMQIKCIANTVTLTYNISIIFIIVCFTVFSQTFRLSVTLILYSFFFCNENIVK